jgi:hypothetical protein
MFFTISSQTNFQACGSSGQCCAFGYNCVQSSTAGNFCTMAKERSSLGRSPNDLGTMPQGSATFAATTATSSVPSSLFSSASPSGQPGSSNKSNSTAGGAESDNKAVSTGAIAGIAVAAVAGLGLIAAAATWFLRRKRKQDRKDSDDSEIKPYAFTTPGGDGAASDPVARENGVNREVGQHFEKDGDPIQSPMQSPTMQSPNPAYGQPMQAPVNHQPPVNNQQQQAPIQAYQPKVFELA